MHAEYPPDLDIAYAIESIALYDEVSCSMWRMEHRCPNDTNQGVVCADSQGRRFVLPQCSLCARDVETVAADQQATNRLLSVFEFGPEHRLRIPMSDILNRLEMSGRSDEMKIASALKAYGATKEQTHNGARWNGLRWRV